MFLKFLTAIYANFIFLLLFWQTIKLYIHIKFIFRHICHRFEMILQFC